MKCSELFDVRSTECYLCAWLLGHQYAGRPWTLAALGEWLMIAISCCIVYACFLTIEEEESDIR